MLQRGPDGDSFSPDHNIVSSFCATNRVGQHGMDRPGLRKVLDGSEEQTKNGRNWS